jgi:thiol:disulfide interchange protein
MGRFPFLAAVALVALTATGCRKAVPTPDTGIPPAADVVAAAVKRASAEHKVVLIEFGASWCQWCRRFEAFVKAPDTSPIIAANYIVVNLTVREHEDKKGLENPGGNALMDSWGGAASGLPFYVFVDRDGRKIADSNVMPKGDNIGFPGAPEEIAAFMGLVDRTAPALSPADRGVIEGYLTRGTPAPQS